MTFNALVLEWEDFSVSLEKPSLHGPGSPSTHKSERHARPHACTHIGKHAQARAAQDPALGGLPRNRVSGLSTIPKGRPAPSGYGHGGSRPAVCWLSRSQVAGGFPDDLEGHGGTGELGQGVGQGAGGCPKLAQIGHGVYHAAQEEDEKMHPGDEGVRPQEGVNEAQEQEGVDGLHVIPVGSGKARVCGQPGVSREKLVDAGALCPKGPHAPGDHLGVPDSSPFVARRQKRQQL